MTNISHLCVLGLDSLTFSWNGSFLVQYMTRKWLWCRLIIIIKKCFSNFMVARSSMNIVLTSAVTLLYLCINFSQQTTFIGHRWQCWVASSTETKNVKCNVSVEKNLTRCKAAIVIAIQCTLRLGTNLRPNCTANTRQHQQHLKLLSHFPKTFMSIVQELTLDDRKDEGFIMKERKPYAT